MQLEADPDVNILYFLFSHDQLLSVHSFYGTTCTGLLLLHLITFVSNLWIPLCFSTICVAPQSTQAHVSKYRAWATCTVAALPGAQVA
jgi:hypothetical protein